MKLTVKLKDLAKNQFLKFLVIGGFCTIQNIFWLYLLTTICKINYLISTIILNLTINSLGFYLNRKFTFDKNTHFWLQLLKYHLVMFSSFLTILTSMYVLVDIFKIWYIWANLILTVLMTLYNFFSHRKWTFK